MKYIALIFLSLALVASAHADVLVSKKETIQQLARHLARAYEAKDLGSLDAKRPYAGQVKITIEHSLSEDRRVTRTFTTLNKAERWLKSRTKGDMPRRASRKLEKCGAGECTYDFDGGILHNHLYLSGFTYRYSKGRYYIKTISLLDGD